MRPNRSKCGTALKQLHRHRQQGIWCAGALVRWQIARRRQGLTHTQEMDWWDTHTDQGMTFTFAPMQHLSARGIGDRNQTLWAAGRSRHLIWIGILPAIPVISKILRTPQPGLRRNTQPRKAAGLT